MVNGTAQVFKLADLAQLYMSRMEQLGFEHDVRVHTTRLRERLLAHFPAMLAQHQGRDVLLAFNDDLGDALAKACEMDRDVDAVHLGPCCQGCETPHHQRHKGVQWVSSSRTMPT